MNKIERPLKDIVYVLSYSYHTDSDGHDSNPIGVFLNKEQAKKVMLENFNSELENDRLYYDIPEENVCTNDNSVSYSADYGEISCDGQITEHELQ